jgi:hypothetical protein
MADEKFKLPSSSLPELKKIIVGYSHAGENVSVDAVARLIGITRPTNLSANNSFLNQAGIITGKHNKSVTPLGKQLGRAIEHNRADELKRGWQEIVKNNKFLSSLISTLRIKGGMTSNDLVSHILYVADVKRNKHTATGANTLVSILKESNLLETKDGKLTVAATSTATATEEAEEQKSTPAPEVEAKTPIVPAPPPLRELQRETGLHNSYSSPTIAINIQLQLPETENPAVYENLFKALRKHLLNPDTNSNSND